MTTRARLTLTLALVLLACGASQLQAQCIPYYVLSACNNQVNGARNVIDLPPGVLPATSIAVTTIPYYQDWGKAFVTHGANLHVVDYFHDAPLQTLDVAAASGVGGFVVLQDAKAAYGVGVSDGTNHSTQYALYVVGYWSDATGAHPYYWVLDQRAILDEESTDPVLIGHGSLCVDGADCRGPGVSVEVLSPSGDAADQRAYVAYLENPIGGSTFEQKMLRLTRGAAPTGPWAVSLDAWNEEGVAFDAQTYPNIGMEFNRVSGEGHGLFATSQQVVNMETGTRSCVLPGTPVDLSSWALDPEVYVGYAETSYQFVSVQGATSSSVIGFPEGECPDLGQPTSISYPVGHEPVGSVIHQRRHRQFDLHVASKDGTVASFEMRIDGETGEFIPMSQSTRQVDCPTDISLIPPNLCRCELTDENEIFCIDGCQVDEDGNIFCPTGPEPPPPVCLDPQDDSCVTKMTPR